MHAKGYWRARLVLAMDSCIRVFILHPVAYSGVQLAIGNERMVFARIHRSSVWEGGRSLDDQPRAHAGGLRGITFAESLCQCSYGLQLLW